MGNFNFQQYVAPVQNVESGDASGGSAENNAATIGWAEGGKGGFAVGGDSDGGDGGDGGNNFSLLNLFSRQDADGGDGGDSEDGGDAKANGGDAETKQEVDQDADGGDGGTSTAVGVQNTTVETDLEFTDSFNEDNSVTLVKDSGNQDNDGVDNKDGHIEGSTVAGDDMDNSGNTDKSVEIEDSYNDNSDHNSHNDTEIEYENVGNDNSREIEDSFNRSDDDFLDLDLLNNNDILNGIL